MSGGCAEARAGVGVGVPEPADRERAAGTERCAGIGAGLTTVRVERIVGKRSAGSEIRPGLAASLGLGSSDTWGGVVRWHCIGAGLNSSLVAVSVARL